MTTTERINEILSAMPSFPDSVIHKSQLQGELFKLQSEIVSATYNDIHAENGKLRIWDVENHLVTLNEERGHIADDELIAFKEGCKDICNAIKAEISGNAGERKAAHSIEMVRCKKHVLQNIEFTTEDFRTELDFIVFTEKAIFIIEVKNPSKDICIDEHGNYCRIGTTLSFDKNIGESMNHKSYLLRQALSTSGYENPVIESFVVFANNNITVENYYDYIEIAFLSNLPHKIERYTGSALYTDLDMQKMVDAVEKVACKELYPLPFDVNQFKLNFAKVIAKLEGYVFEDEKSFSIVEEERDCDAEANATVSDLQSDKTMPSTSLQRSKGVNLTTLNAVVIGIICAVTGFIAGDVYRMMRR